MNSESYILDVVSTLPCNLRQSCDACKDEVVQDLSSTIGLLWFLKLALRCKEGALGLLGTPCNSFNWMSSSQHGRSPDFPWGNLIHTWVNLGNILGSRSCLVVLTLISRSVYWMLENPDRSAITVLPPLVHIMSIPEIQPLRVYWWGSQ